MNLRPKAVMAKPPGITRPDLLKLRQAAVEKIDEELRHIEFIGNEAEASMLRFLQFTHTNQLVEAHAKPETQPTRPSAKKKPTRSYDNWARDTITAPQVFRTPDVVKAMVDKKEGSLVQIGVHASNATLWLWLGGGTENYHWGFYYPGKLWFPMKRYWDINMKGKISVKQGLIVHLPTRRRVANALTEKVQAMVQAAMPLKGDTDWAKQRWLKKWSVENNVSPNMMGRCLSGNISRTGRSMITVAKLAVIAQAMDTPLASFFK